MGAFLAPVGATSSLKIVSTFLKVFSFTTIVTSSSNCFQKLRFTGPFFFKGLSWLYCRAKNLVLVKFGFSALSVPRFFQRLVLDLVLKTSNSALLVLLKNSTNTMPNDDDGQDNMFPHVT